MSKVSLSPALFRVQPRSVYDARSTFEQRVEQRKADKAASLELHAWSRRKRIPIRDFSTAAAAAVILREVKKELPHLELEVQEYALLRF